MENLEIKKKILKEKINLKIVKSYKVLQLKSLSTRHNIKTEDKVKPLKIE
jgi:hypothetical protein